MMKALEAHLAFLNVNRQQMMSGEQRKLASVQHECRMLRNAPSACDDIQESIGRACEECLRRVGIKKD